MAKRKKNKIQVEPMALEEIIAAQNEFRDVMDNLGKTLGSMNFSSEEELSAFLNSKMTGKSLSEISAELDELRGPGAPETPLEAANRLLDGLSWDASSAEMIAKAIEALEISPDCVAAHVVLGDSEDSAENALLHYEAAVKLGRELHADRIAAVGENGPGLWVSNDARDFLTALERLADVVEGPEGPAEGSRRLEIFQEIIRLNPTDNLGIRSKLLAEYYVNERLDDASKLLNQFQDDVLPAMVFGRPLLALTKIIVATDYQMPELDFSDPEHFTQLRKRLPSSFRSALALLEDAVRKNPSIALFSMEPGIMEVEVPDEMLIGGPYEAVEYLQEWGTLWLATGLPIFLLQSYVSPKLLKLIKTKDPVRAELRDIQEQLDEAEGASWIEEFFADADFEDS